MKILIIQQKMIGDVLTSSILFKAIRDKYPEEQLHYLIRRNTYAVIQENPFIDKVIFDLEDKNGNSISFFQFAKNIRKANYDVVIDVYSKIATAILTGLSGAKIRSGIKKSYTSLFYTHTFKNKKHSQTSAG
ncbi:MAG: glycosyltransferase family 9 protein, partial [Leeuwenhoekiella sp.]